MLFCFCRLHCYDYRNRGDINMNKYGYCLNDTGKPPKLWRIVECYEKHLLITDEQKTIIINTAEFWQII